MKTYKIIKGVYIHTPFCLQKCLYCDFPSYAGFSAAARERYVSALCGEIAQRAAGEMEQGPKVAETATVYFGGGTPTTLSPRKIGRIVRCLKENGWWKEPAEATIEANPGTVTTADLVELRRMGFDRISFGVQSFQEAEIKALGRIHTAQQAQEAVRWAQEAGFRRINIDLMSGIPGQTAASWQDTLAKATALGTEHISAYSLILEAGTPLDALVAQGKIVLPTEEESLEMYEMTTAILEENGLRRYEISNYARPGCESRHNLLYWHYEPYAAFGAGACTFTGQLRYTNTADVDTYLRYWEAENRGGWADYRESEPLSPEIRLAEAIIMGLRVTEGLSLSGMEQRFGVDILTRFGRELDPFFKKMMLARQGDRLYLTPYGMRFGNQVFAAFLP